MLYSIRKIIKHLSICLIINILVLSIMFSSANNSSSPDVKEENSKAIITFKDGKKPPEDPDDVDTLSANITFTDANGNNVDVVEAESFIKFEIKVKTDKKYKDGKVTKCVIYETANPSNRESLYNIRSKFDNIEDWVWDIENQKLGTNFIVTKLLKSESDEFTIECFAIVCKNKCPTVSLHSIRLMEAKFSGSNVKVDKKINYL